MFSLPRGSEEHACMHRSPRIYSASYSRVSVGVNGGKCEVWMHCCCCCAVWQALKPVGRRDAQSNSFQLREGGSTFLLRYCWPVLLSAVYCTAVLFVELLRFYSMIDRSVRQGRSRAGGDEKGPDKTTAVQQHHRCSSIVISLHACLLCSKMRECLGPAE